MSEREKWKDTTPIDQYEGGPAPIAPIPYPKQYVEVLGYFRAVLAKDEISNRALELTGEVIGLSSGNYTAWHYRRKLIDKLGHPLELEMNWLRGPVGL